MMRCGFMVSIRPRRPHPSPSGLSPMHAPSMYLRPPRSFGDALRTIGDHVARARYVLSKIEAAVLVSGAASIPSHHFG